MCFKWFLASWSIKLNMVEKILLEYNCKLTHSAIWLGFLINFTIIWFHSINIHWGWLICFRILEQDKLTSPKTIYNLKRFTTWKSSHIKSLVIDPKSIVSIKNIEQISFFGTKNGIGFTISNSTSKKIGLRLKTSWIQT